MRLLSEAFIAPLLDAFNETPFLRPLKTLSMRPFQTAVIIKIAPPILNLTGENYAVRPRVHWVVPSRSIHSSSIGTQKSPVTQGRVSRGGLKGSRGLFSRPEPALRAPPYVPW